MGAIQGQSQQTTYEQRTGLLEELQKAVCKTASMGGGVVAVIGKAGVGKSVLAQQFIAANKEARYLDCTSVKGDRTAVGQLSGIAVLDEYWQLPGATEATKKHCRNRGVVVAMGCVESDLRELPPHLVIETLHIPHWGNMAKLEKSPVARDRPQSGIVRFRGPSGQTWTGIGRPPKWLLALETEGHSKEDYRADSTPLKRSTFRARRKAIDSSPN